MKRTGRAVTTGAVILAVYVGAYFLYLGSRIAPAGTASATGDFSFSEVFDNDSEHDYETHLAFRPLEAIRLARAKRKSLDESMEKIQGTWRPFRPEEPVAEVTIEGPRVEIQGRDDWNSLTGTYTLEWPSMIVVNGEEIGISRTPAEGIFVEDGERYVDGDSAWNGLIIERGDWSGEVFDAVLVPRTEQVAEPDA